MSKNPEFYNRATKIDPPIELEVGKLGHPFTHLGSSAAVEPTGIHRGSVASIVIESTALVDSLSLDKLVPLWLRS